jgi:hypothetical protein
MFSLSCRVASPRFLVRYHPFRECYCAGLVQIRPNRRLRLQSTVCMICPLVWPGDVALALRRYAPPAPPPAPCCQHLQAACPAMTSLLCAFGDVIRVKTAPPCSHSTPLRPWVRSLVCPIPVTRKTSRACISIVSTCLTALLGTVREARVLPLCFLRVFPQRVTSKA